LGCYEISLGDTLGVSTPITTIRLLDYLTRSPGNIPLSRLAVHFHDTYGMALSNVWISLLYGISTIDSSIAGLGGCPYAKGAQGNVSTEDVLYMLYGSNISTGGINIEHVLETSQWLKDTIGLTSRSRAGSALQHHRNRNRIE